MGPPVVFRKSSLVILPPTKRSLAMPAPPHTMNAPLVVWVDGVGGFDSHKLLAAGHVAEAREVGRAFDDEIEVEGCVLSRACV